MMAAMKHKVAELEGALLDAAVAKAERIVLEPEWVEVSTFADLARGERRMVLGGPGIAPRFSSDWAYGGPIIERERICIQCPDVTDARGMWAAIALNKKPAAGWQEGPTPLIAAMRAFVASKFGDEVELP